MHTRTRGNRVTIVIILVYITYVYACHPPVVLAWVHLRACIGDMVVNVLMT